MTPAALTAVYTNFKLIRSRKMVEISFEVPMETWPKAAQVLGMPSIEQSTHFAIAKLQVPSEPAPTPKEQGSNLAANAALMLKEAVFQRFLKERDPGPHWNCPVGDTWNGDDWRQNAADRSVKKLINITSKRELNTDPAAAERWRELRREFEAWKQL